MMLKLLKSALVAEGDATAVAGCSQWQLPGDPQAFPFLVRWGQDALWEQLRDVGGFQVAGEVRTCLQTAPFFAHLG